MKGSVCDTLSRLGILLPIGGPPFCSVGSHFLTWLGGAAVTRLWLDILIQLSQIRLISFYQLFAIHFIPKAGLFKASLWCGYSLQGSGDLPIFPTEFPLPLR